MNNEKEKVVISVGGSLIVPEVGIDTHFLTQFNALIRSQVEENPNRQFFLVAGGGDTARKYIKAAELVLEHSITNDDKDWLGIHTTRVNAQLLRTIFQDIAHPYVLKHYDVFIRKVSEPVVCAAGWRPGRSTDYCAVTICQDYQVDQLVNLTNIKRVYDKDPNVNSDATPFDQINWSDLRKIVGSEWIPGMNAPFDPIASELAQRLGIRATILNGRDFNNIRDFFSGRSFVGTVIEGI